MYFVLDRLMNMPMTTERYNDGVGIVERSSQFDLPVSRHVAADAFTKP